MKLEKITPIYDGQELTENNYKCYCSLSQYDDAVKKIEQWGYILTFAIPDEKLNNAMYLEFTKIKNG